MFSAHPVTKQALKILVNLPVTLPANFRSTVDQFYDQWEIVRNGTLENLCGIGILCFPPAQHAHVISLVHRGQPAGTLLVHWLSSPSVGSKRSSQGRDYIATFQS